MGCLHCLDIMNNETFSKSQIKEYNQSFDKSGDEGNSVPVNFITLSKIKKVPIAIEDSYWLERSIDGGAYGNSMICRRKSDRVQFMMKILLEISLREPGMDYIKEYYEKLKELNCEYLNKIVDLIENEENFVVITEYCYKGNLNNMISDSTSWNDKKEVLCKVIKGLQYLKSQGIVHGNVCEENILFFEDGPKLSDYGHCKFFVNRSNMAKIYTFSDDCKGFLRILEKMIQGVKNEDVEGITKFILDEGYADETNEIDDKKIEEIYGGILEVLENSYSRLETTV